MTISNSSKQFVANASSAQLMQMLQTTYCPAYDDVTDTMAEALKKDVPFRRFMGSRYSRMMTRIQNADNQPTYRGLQHSLLFTADIAENGGIDYLDRPAFIAFCDALGFPLLLIVSPPWRLTASIMSWAIPRITSDGQPNRPTSGTAQES